MSELLDDGELPSGYFFAGPTATPVGGNTGILPANGEVVSLATYPGLTWMNTNIGFLPGPVFTTLFGAPGFNVLQSSGPGGEMLYNYSSVIGPYYILCGSNNVPNSTIGIGASVCISSDLQNWSISQINTVVGSICVGIVKAGATYYATVQGTNAQSYIYSSTNLTSWAIAFTFTGGTAVYGVSQMIATGSIVASLQGGTTNISFYNGVTWYTDTNNIGANNYLSNFNTLSTGEIGGIALTSSGSNGIYSFTAWKFGVGAACFAPRLTACFHLLRLIRLTRSSLTLAATTSLLLVASSTPRRISHIGRSRGTSSSSPSKMLAARCTLFRSIAIT
jgi:hypothetical protein